jgi:hypothetical protein
VAALQSMPGYMDAEYYFAGGLRLAQGFGFSEPYIWNYLGNPGGLPVPSHAYWLPLPSILAAAGMRLFDAAAFPAARLPFLLLAAFIPPLTAALAYRLHSHRDLAVLSGLLAIFPGFYLPFLTTTDTFTLTLVLGACFFLLVLNQHSSPLWAGGMRAFTALALGLLAGFIHLARAEGPLWLLAALAAAWLFRPAGARRLLINLGFVLAGYALAAGPWMVRNLAAFGVPLSPGGQHALWLTHYNELFIYPASLLDFQHWWSTGLQGILSARLWALGQNTLTLVAVQGNVFLFPLLLIGFWVSRKDVRLQLALFVWAVTLAVMTLVFPFPGARGGYFHAGAGLQPVFWAVAPVGLERFVAWGQRRRGWQPAQAFRFFAAGLVALSILVTAAINANRFFGSNQNPASWGISQRTYADFHRIAAAQGLHLEGVMLTVNPPAYYLATGEPAIAIPDGDEGMAYLVAQSYGGKYMLLERNHPQGLKDLYETPRDVSGWRYVLSIEGVHLFEFVEEE